MMGQRWGACSRNDSVARKDGAMWEVGEKDVWCRDGVAVAPRRLNPRKLRHIFSWVTRRCVGLVQCIRVRTRACLRSHRFALLTLLKR